MSRVRSPFSSTCTNIGHIIAWSALANVRCAVWQTWVVLAANVPPGTPKSAQWCPAPGSGPHSHTQVSPVPGRPVVARTPECAQRCEFSVEYTRHRFMHIIASMKKLWATHPVAGALGLRILYGLDDAVQIAVKVQRPLVQVARGKCGKPVMHGD
jgi:hypothetical protein